MMPLVLQTAPARIPTALALVAAAVTCCRFYAFSSAATADADADADASDVTAAAAAAAAAAFAASAAVALRPPILTVTLLRASSSRRMEQGAEWGSMWIGSLSLVPLFFMTASTVFTMVPA
jgi:hypothetical protein